MEGNPQKHLLRAFYGHMLARRDYVALQKQVEARIGKQLVALGPQKTFRLFDFRTRIVLQDIRAVEVLVGKPDNLAVKRYEIPREAQLRASARRKEKEQRFERPRIPISELPA